VVAGDVAFWVAVHPIRKANSTTAVNKVVVFMMLFLF
jgi:hypothetical protein